MKLLDLFSGIGGFSLAAIWAGMTPVQFVEQDEYCQQVLKKNFEGVPIHGDIKTYKVHPGSADIISGGFPCQPFSCAGKQRGTEDDRYLWPEMFRVISEVRPSWVIGENVAGIVGMELDKVLSDLEGEDYDVQSFIIPACAVDAKHRRNRVWIVANSNTERIQRGEVSRSVKGCRKKRNQLFERRSEEISFWPAEPDVGRVANGVSDRMDRLRALGNAIVPQVAYQIFKAIMEVERENA